MNDKFLSYYNQELFGIRELADKFAIQNPKVAGRLRMGPGYCDDPHVSRIIEAFAFLTAQLQLKIDDDFALICETLLSQIYPHYVKTIPAMSIIQLVAASHLTSSYNLPKGTLIKATTIEEVECKFQTSYETNLLPISIVNINLESNYSRDLARLSRAENIKSALTIEFKANEPSFNISGLRGERVRLFINLNTFSALKCYEMLCSAVESILFTSTTQSVAIGKSPKLMIKQVGFAVDEAILPYSDNSLSAYRLLTEYFVFPEKFLFIDLLLLDERESFDFGNHFSIVLFLNKRYSELENVIQNNSLLLGCTPIINLFPYQAEPIHYDGKSSYSYIVPDVRKRDQLDIVDVVKISAINELNQNIECCPFYSIDHDLQTAEPGYYWQVFPISALENDSSYHFQPSIKLALVDASAKLIDQPLVITADLLCSNGDLVCNLPYGSEQRSLCLYDESPVITAVNSIKPFTKAINPRDRQGWQWKFLSHLQLNYLSISGSEKAVEALQELLRLYDFYDSPDTKKIIHSIHAITTQHVTKRGPGTMQKSMCTGVKIILKVDISQFKESSCYLFVSILNVFFTLYVSINSFVELTVISHQDEGVLFQWPAMIGSKPLI